jgi:hypothetical protein
MIEMIVFDLSRVLPRVSASRMPEFYAACDLFGRNAALRQANCTTEVGKQ